MPRTYRVVYEVDVECVTPEEAACTAFEIMAGGGLRVLQVIEWPVGTSLQVVEPNLGWTIDLERLLV